MESHPSATGPSASSLGSASPPPADTKLYNSGQFIMTNSSSDAAKRFPFVRFAIRLIS